MSSGASVNKQFNYWMLFVCGFIVFMSSKDAVIFNIELMHTSMYNLLSEQDQTDFLYQTLFFILTATIGESLMLASIIKIIQTYLKVKK